MFVMGIAAVVAPSIAEEPVTYLQYDAKITGDQIHYFKDNEEIVSLVLGGFRLSVGDRVISGDNAVVWINTQAATEPGGQARHDVTVYVEGNARVVDSDGTRTNDTMMLVKVHLQGRLSAAGEISSQRLQDFPIYRRARATRQEEAAMQHAWRQKARQAGVRTPPKPIVVREAAGREDIDLPEPDTQPGRRDLAGETRLEDMGTDTDARTDGSLPDRLTDTTTQPAAPAESTPPSKVHFEAAGGVVAEQDPETPDKRTIIAKGNVLITQGTPDSHDYMELRSQSAVVFTRKGLPEHERIEQAPYAPDLVGAGGAGGEKVTGVYLEGDVIISRGERSMQGNAAYYDFVHEKATILQPVFRTVQEQRNIPIYIRAEKANVTGPKEIKFQNAIVSTSDFKTPTYHLGAREVTFRDETPYDADGEQLGPQKLSAEYENATWNVRGLPVLWSPMGKTSFEEGHTALRKGQIGRFGDLGWGAETQWHLFRLLGVVQPEGVSAKLNLNGYQHGATGGIDLEYARQERNRQYAGYGILYGVYDGKANDDFGDERKNIAAQQERGRVLLRHKEFLPRDWQIQGELSVLSDRNFLERYYPGEFWTGKDQENLIYAKKQRDNWAITALLKARFNSFLTQTESLPEGAAYLIGQPLLGDRLTYHGEARLGGKRFREGGYVDSLEDSQLMARFDTLHELSMPLQPKTPLGPVNIVPYVKGRFTFWSDSLDENDNCLARAYGQAGVRANMHFWRIYNNVQSRLWDVHRLKHIITPEVVAFTSTTGGVNRNEVYPLDPGIEQYIDEMHGVKMGIHQRLQTKRGPAGEERTVDWMRLDVDVAMFSRQAREPIGNGRMFVTNPEYSVPRDSLNAEYLWNISDTTAFLADLNWDFQSGLDNASAGFAVQRDPRLSYYFGMRYIHHLDSAVATAGMKYRINKKYWVELFEQYDFRYRDGVNLGTRVRIVRKFPRWNVGLTFLYDQLAQDEDSIGVILAIWPEGVPEVQIGSGRMELLGSSDRN
jgi:hypothetical protein